MEDGKKMLPVAERLERVLAFTFKGIHNCGPIHKKLEGTPSEHWEVSKYSGPECFEATCDGDFLTRFVFACHAYCARGGIGPSGRGMIKLQISARHTRVGQLIDRHQDMEEAVAKLRGGDISDWAFEEEKGGG